MRQTLFLPWALVTHENKVTPRKIWYGGCCSNTSWGDIYEHLFSPNNFAFCSPATTNSTCLAYFKAVVVPVPTAGLQHSSFPAKALFPTAPTSPGDVSRSFRQPKVPQQLRTQRRDPPPQHSPQSKSNSVFKSFPQFYSILLEKSKTSELCLYLRLSRNTTASPGPLMLCCEVSSHSLGNNLNICR